MTVKNRIPFSGDHPEARSKAAERPSHGTCPGEVARRHGHARGGLPVRRLDVQHHERDGVRQSDHHSRHAVGHPDGGVREVRGHRAQDDVRGCVRRAGERHEDLEPAGQCDVWLEPDILSIIDKQEVYTSDILEALRQADLLVVEGTLYPLLSRLKNNGLLKYRWQESTDGPPRKYFTLTDEGQEMLAALNQEWSIVSNAITKITNR